MCACACAECVGDDLLDNDIACASRCNFVRRLLFYCVVVLVTLAVQSSLVVGAVFLWNVSLNLFLSDLFLQKCLSTEEDIRRITHSEEK